MGARNTRDQDTGSGRGDSRLFLRIARADCLAVGCRWLLCPPRPGLTSPNNIAKRGTRLQPHGTGAQEQGSDWGTRLTLSVASGEVIRCRWSIAGAGRQRQTVRLKLWGPLERVECASRKPCWRRHLMCSVQERFSRVGPGGWTRCMVGTSPLCADIAGPRLPTNVECGTPGTPHRGLRALGCRHWRPDRAQSGIWCVSPLTTSILPGWRSRHFETPRRPLLPPILVPFWSASLLFTLY